MKIIRFFFILQIKGGLVIFFPYSYMLAFSTPGGAVTICKMHHVLNFGPFNLLFVLGIFFA